MSTSAILILPSLSLKGEDNAFGNLTKGEAEYFTLDFDARVIATHKTATDDASLNGIKFFEGTLRLEELADAELLEALIVSLQTSNIRGKRGKRAVYLDIENDIVGVGYTVVYNENRAMSGVDDPSIPVTLLNAVSELDLLDAAA